MITTADGAALLQAIIDDPDDDLVRLAYADWLDEGGQAGRAEFIRAQIGRERMAAMTGREPDYDPQKLWDLIAAEGKYDYERGVWCPLGSRATWRRGFVESVRCTLDDWRAHGPALAKAHPVTRVEITDRSPYDASRSGNKNPWLWMSSLRWDGRENEGGVDELPSWLWPTYLAAFGGRKQVGYPDRDAALDALSAACILWARARP